jgi:CheY-like chemotaxis protein
VHVISPTDNPRVSTVLVVDDEPIVRDVVVRYLERDGYRTLEAATGDEARRLLEREPPSLVVLDVMLPGVDALELCRWIRSRSEVPIAGLPVATLAALAIVVGTTAGGSTDQSSRAAPSFNAAAPSGRLDISSLRRHSAALAFVQAGCGSCVTDLRNLSALAPASSGGVFS